MKKVLYLVLAMTMVFALFAACGKVEGEAQDADASDAADAADAVEPGDAADTADSDEPDDAADDSEEVKTLVMATNAAFPPYEFYQSNEVVGIDAEIAAAIAEELGMKLEIIDMDFLAIIPAVQSGKADFGAAGMTVTEDRLESVNFSDSYATGVQVIIVKEGSSIKSAEDLAGIKIGVQQSTTGDIYITDEFGEDAVERFQNGGLAVLALTQGKVDAVVIDSEPAKAFVEANEGLAILDTEYAVEDYAIAIAKDNEDLLANVNTALAKLKDSGKLDEIISKYITAE